MKLTAQQWLSENSERQELALQNIPLAMELYAKYRETELSRPPKDVVEAIEKAYPYSTAINDVSSATRRAHITGVQLQRNAALHGYSLASGEAVSFAEWILQSSYVMEFGGWTNIHRKDGIITTAQLFELFKKERNG